MSMPAKPGCAASAIESALTMAFRQASSSSTWMSAGAAIGMFAASFDLVPAVGWMLEIIVAVEDGN